LRSYEEIEAERAPARDAALLNHTIERTAAQRDEVFTRLQNIQTTCLELSEVAFTLHSGDPASRNADLRSLLAVLKAAEVNLEAAVERLAGELGLLAV
jgi:hypothetical protein